VQPVFFASIGTSYIDQLSQVWNMHKTVQIELRRCCNRLPKRSPSISGRCLRLMRAVGPRAADRLAVISTWSFCPHQGLFTRIATVCPEAISARSWVSRNPLRCPVLEQNVNSPDARDSESNATGVEGRSLEADERDAFLEGGLLARLACLDGDGWPYIVPVWFHWDGERFWIVGTPTSSWADYVAVDSRVSLCIDEPTSLRRVICQGHAQLEEGPTVNGRWVSYGRRMSARYLGDAAAAYDREMVNFAGSLFAVTPKRLITWQGPGRHRRR
jgi:hypothetical protein